MKLKCSLSFLSKFLLDKCVNSDLSSVKKDVANVCEYCLEVDFEKCRTKRYQLVLNRQVKRTGKSL